MRDTPPRTSLRRRPTGCETWTVTNAGHTEGLEVAPEEWTDRVVTFLTEALLDTDRLTSGRVSSQAAIWRCPPAGKYVSPHEDEPESQPDVDQEQHERPHERRARRVVRRVQPGTKLVIAANGPDREIRRGRESEETTSTRRGLTSDIGTAAGIRRFDGAERVSVG